MRAIGQQYSFTPQCIVVPADTPITLRTTSADVVHGLLIEGTNVNAMLVPGYVAELPIRFKAPAGPHKVGVTFLRRTAAESDDRLQMFLPGGGQDHVLQVRSFQISGVCVSACHTGGGGAILRPTGAL